MWLPREDGPNESRPSARSSSSYRQIQGPAPPATPARRRRWAGRRQAGQQLSTCCHLSPTAPALDCWPCSAWRTRQRADMSRLIFDTQALADPGTRRQLYRSVAAATRKLCTGRSTCCARAYSPIYRVLSSWRVCRRPKPLPSNSCLRFPMPGCPASHYRGSACYRYHTCVW